MVHKFTERFRCLLAASFMSDPQPGSAPYCIRACLEANPAGVGTVGTHRCDPVDPVSRSNVCLIGSAFSKKTNLGSAYSTLSDASRMAGLSSPVETVCDLPVHCSLPGPAPASARPALEMAWIMHQRFEHSVSYPNILAHIRLEPFQCFRAHPGVAIIAQCDHHGRPHRPILTEMTHLALRRR